jgi:DNA polymerase I-like protein with 3'-5' exonuclease and polymerase domains
LAWVPQSTVAEVSFRGGIALERRFKWVEMLLQVHDSLVFQVPHAHENRITDMQSTLAVPIPYPTPLTIRWGFARSRVSWGECEKVGN